MTGIFIRLLNMSLAAGWVVLAILVLRLIFRRAPKAFAAALWALAAIRLVLPWSIKSVLSLIPSRETVPPTIVSSPHPAVSSGFEAVNNQINPVLEETFAPAASAAGKAPLAVITEIAAWVWLAGVILMLLYAAFSYLRLCHTVKGAKEGEKKVFRGKTVQTPFILGVIRPKIYLPYGMDERTEELVLCHERAHLRRGDHFWKPFGWLLLSVYWFNPLMWLGYILFTRDIELACDEKVAEKLDIPARADYSEALLKVSRPGKLVSACPLAFGEVGIKARVRSVLNYKKPAFWIILAAILASVVAAVCLLTDPVEKDKDKSLTMPEGDYQVDDVIYYNGAFSFIEKRENALYYRFEGKKLSVAAGDNGVWEEMGKLEACSPTEEEIKKAFNAPEMWSEGYTREEFIENAAECYFLKSNKLFFMLIIAEDGNYYMVQGGYALTSPSTTEPEDTTEPCVRWIERLMPLDPADEMMPPALTVTVGEESWEPMRGTYSWESERGSCEGDSAHPLENPKWMQRFETSEDTATLTFAREPQTVSVRRWSDRYLGDVSKDDQAKETGLIAGELTLENGGWIYEVRAEWAAGNCNYAFYIVKGETPTVKDITEPVFLYHGMAGQSYREDFLLPKEIEEYTVCRTAEQYEIYRNMVLAYVPDADAEAFPILPKEWFEDHALVTAFVDVTKDLSGLGTALAGWTREGDELRLVIASEGKDYGAIEALTGGTVHHCATILYPVDLEKEEAPTGVSYEIAQVTHPPEIVLKERPGLEKSGSLDKWLTAGSLERLTGLGFPVIGRDDGNAVFLVKRGEKYSYIFEQDGGKSLLEVDYHGVLIRLSNVLAKTEVCTLTEEEVGALAQKTRDLLLLDERYTLITSEDQDDLQLFEWAMVSENGTIHRDNSLKAWVSKIDGTLIGMGFFYNEKTMGE